MAKQHVDSGQPGPVNYSAKVEYTPHESDSTKDSYRVRVSNNGQPVIDKQYLPNEFINRVVRAQGETPRKYATIKHDKNPETFNISTWGDR